MSSRTSRRLSGRARVAFRWGVLFVLLGLFLPHYRVWIFRHASFEHVGLILIVFGLLILLCTLTVWLTRPEVSLRSRAWHEFVGPSPEMPAPLEGPPPESAENQSDSTQPK